MMLTSDLPVVVTDNLDWIPFVLPHSEGVFVKIFRVDEENGQVIAKIKMAPNSAAPRHFHFCQAIAFTISGSWRYDEGEFQTGDMAVEPIGNTHTPSSEEGTEMLLIFDTHYKDGRLLDNYMMDGSVVRIGTSLLKQLEGKSLAEMEGFDPTPYIEVYPTLDAAEEAR